MLHFNSIPNYKFLEGIYYQLQEAKTTDDREKNEEILLQCILISVQAPLSLKLVQNLKIINSLMNNGCQLVN